MIKSIDVIVKGLIRYKNQYLAIQRSCEDEIGPGTWECPGGKINFGENLTEALLREVSEETGLCITVKKLLYATTFFINENRQAVVLCYYCTAEDISTFRLSYEHQNFCWITKNELLSVLQPVIVNDFKTFQVLKQLDEFL